MNDIIIKSSNAALLLYCMFNPPVLEKGHSGDSGWVCEALLGIRVKQRGYKCVCCHVSSCDPEEDMFLSLTHTHTQHVKRGDLYLSSVLGVI